LKRLGITGTPHCLLLLALALEKAKPDQRVVCIGYGDGCDAFLVKTTDKILSIKGKSKINAYISSKGCSQIMVNLLISKIYGK